MPSSGVTRGQPAPPRSAWARRAALLVSCLVAGAAAAPVSERLLEGLGWRTDAGTVFIVCCLPVLAALCFLSGRLDPRSWWIYGVPTAAAYVASTLRGEESLAMDPESLAWLSVALVFIAFYAAALTVAAWIGSRAAARKQGG